ncbi:fluoride efflux transporter CrcB [Gammaproteobacteria bacterium]|nr:fluoride efflux transporter CrcB [Gammaproteobacteria bacterium]MBT4782394.1 fluoride efflux transporter CrcB [Gammaproteobacteria bacterium]MBT6316933.1 fluoride efflux transporter CrcB [Gammaproteobacteria bacterium]MBT6548690.1 fluoride efflux transporter CrcB [Gammaproteobacteria bacterium]MBT7763932.1 fluoride efflux transporter CrcB [Gammaproteobacteria bacterium]
MNTFVAVAVGGALGAVSRYSFGLVALALIGNRFPWATLGVNVVGSFLIGLAAVLIGDRIVDGELWRPLVIVGFLGAFTTFSAFSLDTLLLLQQGNYNTALAYMLGSVALCLGGTVSGMQLAKIFA